MVPMVRIVLFQALTLGAAGCTTLWPEQTFETAAIVPPHKPPPPPRVFHRQPVALRKPSEPTPASQAAPPPVATDKQALPAPHALQPPTVQLVGLGQEEVRHLLGAPVQVVERPPAVVWVYLAPGCRLELSFYMDLASRAFQVLSDQTTPQGRDGLAGEACVGSLRRAAG